MPFYCLKPISDFSLSSGGYQLGIEYRPCGDLPWASRIACPLFLTIFNLMLPRFWAVQVFRLLYWLPFLAMLVLYRHVLSDLSHHSSCFIYSRMLSLVSLLSIPEIGLGTSVSPWYYVPNSIIAVAWIYLWLYYLLMCLACWRVEMKSGMPSTVPGA